MTRTEFAKVVANKMKQKYPNAGISNGDAKIWTVAVFDCLADCILKRESVTAWGLGTFDTYVTKPHKRGDIKSKSTVVDPPRVKLRFTVARAFNDEISNLPVE